ncbi:unnamed protein product [Peronospora belbahrii]|uniref:Borealin N-terminal domain-containing protein n=1 Tax=Peronospora belbahrii TaxID=622444 RepID=A0ABN8D5Q4_9STRA|nr:unnamed protein product [Peronospora belbahrii]
MSLSSSTAPLHREVRRVQARHRRREAAAPYSMFKHVEGGEKRDEETSSTRRDGFFSRLASYIPIVNKLMKEEEEDEVEEDHVKTRDSEMEDDIQTTQENDEEEEEEEKKKEEEMMLCAGKIKKTMLDAATSPMKHEVTHKKKTSPRFLRQNKSKKGSQTLSFSSASSFCESGSENGEDCLDNEEKRDDNCVSLPGPSQQSKKVRSITQRRRKSIATSPYDSALAAIKEMKTITLEEYERLQHQLHEMVETTPQTQLAMTQAALANGLERPFTRGFPGPPSFPGYMSGLTVNPSHDSLVIQNERKRGSADGVPFSKRPRNRENAQSIFSGTSLRGLLTREERLLRKPRPSRLLTGAKRNASERNAYSAAVVEKILTTLNKLQTPLERETQKPTPSTSMSWAKYHLSLVDGQQKSLGNEAEANNDDVPPPTTTVPRVAFPQPSAIVAASSFGGTQSTVVDTPLKSANAVSNGVASLFSPQVISMTPAPIAKISATGQLQYQTTGQFKFTLPVRVEGVQQAEVDDEDTRVQFVFSPPPSMRDPPVKVSNRKTARKDGGHAAPFDFVPLSPKMKVSEWISKPPTVKELRRSRRLT